MSIEENYAAGYDTGITWEKRFPGDTSKPGGPWYDRRGGTPDREQENKAWLKGWADGLAAAAK